MSTAIYARVSTTAQAHSQSCEQQLARLSAHCEARGWSVSPQHVFRDDGFSGSQLARPGLDQLRGRVRLGEVGRLLIACTPQDRTSSQAPPAAEVCRHARERHKPWQRLAAYRTDRRSP